MEITTKNLATAVSAIDGNHGEFSVAGAFHSPSTLIYAVKNSVPLIGNVFQKTKAMFQNQRNDNRERG